MPRNAAGIYTLPNAPVVPDTTITSPDENGTRNDIAAELTNSLDRNGRGGMLAPFKIADGDANTPGLGFLNDPNCGLYRINADDIALSVGGVKVMEFIPTSIICAAALAFPFVSVGAGITATGVNGLPIGVTAPSTGAFTTLTTSGILKSTASGVFGPVAGEGNFIGQIQANDGTGGTDIGTTSLNHHAAISTNAVGKKLLLLNWSGAVYNAVGAFTATGLDACAIGATTPSTGAFTSLRAQLPATGDVLSLTVAAATFGVYSYITPTQAGIFSAAGGTGRGVYWDANAVNIFLGASVAAFTTAGLNACVIGATTPSTGAFTNLTSNSLSVFGGMSVAGAASFTLAPDFNVGFTIASWQGMGFVGNELRIGQSAFATQWDNVAIWVKAVKGLSVNTGGTLTLPAYGGGGGLVSVGAADSGGVGFKLLRVPN